VKKVFLSAWQGVRYTKVVIRFGLSSRLYLICSTRWERTGNSWGSENKAWTLYIL